MSKGLPKGPGKPSGCIYWYRFEGAGKHGFYCNLPANDGPLGQGFYFCDKHMKNAERLLAEQRERRLNENFSRAG